MKNFLNMALIITLTTVTQTAYATEIMAIYTTGDVLTAATLDTIKNAVNDNNTRITAIEAAPPEDGEDGEDGKDGKDGTGSPGLIGAQGTQGIQGIQGPTGAKGDTGIQGIQGTTGPTGAKGDAGIQGVQGTTGLTGDTGIQGIQGETGLTGAKGDTGIQGIQGETGLTGAKGDMGIQGIQGETGLTGSQGVAGNDGSDGVNSAGPFINTRAPISSDDVSATFLKGAIWVDTIGEEAYILIDNASSSAIWKQITPLVYALGDTGPGGGLVFYVTADGMHGLEVTPADSSSSVWGCVSTDITRADGTAIGTGQPNTVEILHLCSDPTSAAQVTTNYTVNGFYDWYLPSKDELNQIFCVLGNSAGLRTTCTGLPGTLNVVGFNATNYWSSSQIDATYAWEQSFDSGTQGAGTAKSTSLGVRAVREF
jgi:hypothetical protein